MARQKSAFTLVEMAIVLVIIGLLAGAVVVGQSMIRNAQLQDITLQYQKFTGAVKIFKQKYNGIPGDIADATDFWGLAASGAGCATTASAGSALTCNGDGNGVIDVSALSNENYRFWQHLANAGLITGNYNGITQGSTNYSSTTANSPSGRISSSLWYAVGWGTRTGTTFIFDGVYGNALEFGMPTTNGDPAASITSPEETYNLDVKLDDGMPATGKLVVRSSMTGAATNCTNASNSAALGATYLLTNKTISCVVVFRQQF